MAEKTSMVREVKRFKKTVFRMGLSGSFKLEEPACVEALEKINYVFWTPFMKTLTPALKSAIAKDREKYVVATGPMLGFFPSTLRHTVEKALRNLGTDYLDVFQLFWLSKMSAFTGAVQEEMQKLKSEGKVRALGVSIHDRPRAGKLAQDSFLDMLMIRYNAAHPGAENDIFPHLTPGGPAVVAYTATSWRRLLRPAKGWKEPVPTAGDCYRFCLSNPQVDVVLTGPRTRQELLQNLAAAEKGPLSEDEMSWMRRFGTKVHG